MLDNFRRRDLPQSARSQSPYSRLQEALSAAGDDPEKAEAFGIESPKPDLRGSAGSAESSRSGGETVSKLIVGPDIKLKGAEITDCDTLVVEVAWRLRWTVASSRLPSTEFSWARPASTSLKSEGVSRASSPRENN